MTRFVAIIAALFLLLTLALPADAGGCVTYSYSAYSTAGYSYYPAGYYGGSYYRAGYYRYVAPVYYPSYSISYDGTAEKLIELLKTEQASKEKLIERLLAQQTAPETLPLKSPLTADAILKRSCIGCHAPAVADDKGESVVLFDDAGEVGPMGKALRKAAIRYVTSTDPARRCPKKGPLPKAEVDALVNWLKQEPAKKE